MDRQWKNMTKNTLTKIRGKVISVMAVMTMTAVFLLLQASLTAAAPTGSDQTVTLPDPEKLLPGQTGEPGNDSELSFGYIPMSWDDNAHVADDGLTPEEVERRIETPVTDDEDEEELSAETALTDPLPSYYPYAYTNTTALKNYFATSLMPTRNQNPFGSCWAHSACSLMELYLAKQMGANVRTVDLSERHLARYTYDGGTGQTVSLTDTGDTYGFDHKLMSDEDKEKLGITDSTVMTIGQKENYYLERGGNIGTAGQTLIKWKGAASESNVPYPTSARTATTVTPTVAWNRSVEYNEDFRMKNMYQINIAENRDLVKRYIREYGGVGTSFLFLEGLYDDTNKSYYCPIASSTNHAVTIVGWDDTFPSSKFKDVSGLPSSNGAWLIRNSWTAASTDLSVYSYFWLSYEDKTIMNTVYAISLQQDGEHLDHNYYYDGYFHASLATSYSETANKKAANVFTVSGSNGDNPQMLEAVSLQMTGSTGGPAGDISCLIEIYKDLQDQGKPDSGTKVHSQETMIPLNGIYTIPLEKGVLLSPGEQFSVVVTLDGGKRVVDFEFSYGVDFATGDANSAISVKCGTNSSDQSFLSYNGGAYWTKASGQGDYTGDFCIGAQTIEVPQIQVSLDVSVPSSPKTTISWTKPSAAQGYELRSSSSIDGVYTTVFTTDNASQNSITKPVSELGGKYYRIYRRVAGVTNENSGSQPVYVSKSGCARNELSASDFTVDTDFAAGEYDGMQHAVSVTGPSGFDGDITVYYQKVKDADGNETDGGGLSTTAPVNAGTYHVYVSAAETDKYDAADRLTKDEWEFTIEKKQLSQQNTVILLGDAPVYDGSGKEATITSVTCDSLTLTQSDYTIKYPASHTNAGTYQCEILGSGNFKGSVSFEFIIDPKDLSTASVTLSSYLSYIYDGKGKEPSGSYVTIKLDNKKLGTADYTLSYQNNIHASPADGTDAPTVIVTGAGNYKGETSVAFAIGQRKLTVRADAVAKTEGNADPEITYQVSGAVSGETPCFTGTLTREEGETPGSYLIRIGTLQFADGEGFLASDYNLFFQENYFSIREKQKHWVEFYANGGVFESQYVKDGDKLTKPVPPTLEYYAFDGWYEDYAFTQAYDFSKPVTSDLYLHAKWKCLHPKEYYQYDNAMEAGCETEGYSGDIRCGICGEILEQGKAIQPTGHIWDAGYISIQPTEYSTGIMHYTCTKCWMWKEEAIDMVPSGHTDPGTGGSGYYDGGYDDYDDYDEEDEEEEDDSLDPKTEKALNKAGFTYIGDGEVRFEKADSKEITSVTIDATVSAKGRTFRVTEIADSAFEDCELLEKVTIGKNVTYIGKNAFKNCKSLKKIVIPKSVRKIGKKAFFGCANLKNIKIKTKMLTVKNVGAKAFKGTYPNATCKVPAGKKKTYKTMLRKKGLNKKAKVK